MILSGWWTLAISYKWQVSGLVMDKDCDLRFISTLNNSMIINAKNQEAPKDT